MKTIAISEEIHRQIGEFGTKNETYNQILERMIESVSENHFAKILLDMSETVSLD